MRTFVTIVLFLFVFTGPRAFAATPDNPVGFHLSFEDFGFFGDEYIAKSGKVPLNDRGLTLEEGRFGKGLKMDKVPLVMDQSNMSSIDGDLHSDIYYYVLYDREDWVRFNEPFFWGEGKLNPGSGAVAFWVKGKLGRSDAAHGGLFDQSALAWGRKEKWLLGITVDDSLRLGAYVTDSRYVDHTVQSRETLDENRWNHVLLNWDKAQGLELFINGKSVASTWGTDCWWMNPLPGLFHLPMPKVIYDEFYIFSRPLSRGEIDTLMNKNIPPVSSGAITERSPSEVERLSRALGLFGPLSIPKVSPLNPDRVLAFREITPSFMGEGKYPARFCQDGRYELAWPHPTTNFTIIPGDSDYPTERIDIDGPEGIPYNYITIEGNFLDMSSVLYDSKKEKDRFTGKTFFDVPQDDRFFHGTMVERTVHPRITLPFLHGYGVPDVTNKLPSIDGYGVPDKYTGDFYFPLTGKTRIHEVGLFDVAEQNDGRDFGEMTYFLRREGSLEDRYDFTLKAIHPLIDRSAFYGYRTVPDGKPEWVNTGALRYTNLFTSPMTGKNTVGKIVLDLKVKSDTPENVLFVRLHDPGIPTRIWTHAEVQLDGFQGEGGRLRLMLDSPPLFLTEHDCIWIDILTRDNAKILINDPDGGKITLKPAPVLESEKAYELKALMPVMAEYTRAYHFQPWLFENTWPDVLHPYAMGGPFDAMMPAQAVKRALPYSRLAEYFIEWGKPKYWWGDFVDPEKNFPIKAIDIPEGVPRWAYVQHIIQNFRYRQVDWEEANQNDDGQFGGGWNDDTEMLNKKNDIILDNYDRALDMFTRIYEGSDKTRQSVDGVTQIVPIDQVHTRDLVRDRYCVDIYKLGDPKTWRSSLRTAWRWNKPDQTPFNWFKGYPFMFDKNILDWYWGTNVPKKAWESPERENVENYLCRIASYCDDILYYRFTEARIHTDSQYIEQENRMVSMVLGGLADSTITVSWPKGGGEDLSRWVTYGDSTRIDCRIFSFDPLPRKVTARVYRLKPGVYRVSLLRDNNGFPGEEISVQHLTLTRFSDMEMIIPPQTPVYLSVQREKVLSDPGPLPDLAVADYDCTRDGGTLSVRVSNLGASASPKAELAVFDETGKKIADGVIPPLAAPTDYVEKSVVVQVKSLPEMGTLRIVVDSGGRLHDMFRGNNETTVK